MSCWAKSSLHHTQPARHTECCTESTSFSVSDRAAGKRQRKRVFSQLLKVELSCTVLNRSCKARVARPTSQSEIAYFVAYSTFNRRMQADSSNVAANLSAKRSSIFTHTLSGTHRSFVKALFQNLPKGK